MKYLLLWLTLCTAAFATNVQYRNGFQITPKIGSINGTAINGISSSSEVNGQTVVLAAETTTWSNGIAVRFGASRPNTRSTWLANAIVRDLAATSYGSKIVYLLPMLGQDNVAALQPLIDTLAVGYADNVGGANFAFSEATGMQGDGATKVLDSRIKPSQLGSSNNGGIGYWENNIDFTGTTIYLPMGCQDTGATNYYALGTYVSYQGLVYWGTAANLAGVLTGAGTNGHYYGQRSGATSREIFKDGSSLATNTTSDPASGASDSTIYMIGFNAHGSALYWKGRCALAYMTDGTFSSGNVSSFHTFLIDHVFTPTGRPTS